jgi:hypothetical protein
MKNQIKAEDTRFPRITRAILRKLNREELADVAKHGADTGWNGFTYYTETNNFFKAHKADILAMAKQDADDFGQEMLQMVQGFNCLSDKNNSKGKPLYSLDEIAAALHSDKGEGSTVIRNALAWYALEAVARELSPEI